MFKYKRDHSVMILFLTSHICELEAEYKNRLKLILTRHQDTKGYSLHLCFVPALLCQGAIERPSSRWFHVPYVLHFLHTLGVGNSISTFTASLFFLLFAILSLLSSVIYTFYLMCAFSFFTPNTKDNWKHTTDRHSRENGSMHSKTRSQIQPFGESAHRSMKFSQMSE